MKVDLAGIDKSFGAVHANVDINLQISAGTIQGILGENGAGKSTLMKILSGYIQADKGDIFLDEKIAKIQSPSDAVKIGIGMLHQDPLDIPSMRAIDNFIAVSKGGLFPEKSKIIKRFNELQAQFNFSIDPEAYIDTLTVGERQQLEILRLLWLGAKVLILDEPTTGISALQKVELFATLRTLAEQGKTVIFVSHKLEDVEQLCHQVAVLRRGNLVGTKKPPYQTEELVQLMFEKNVIIGERETIPPQSRILDLSDFVVEDYRMQTNRINLQVRSGEVIGLAGMEGSGQMLFLRACAGLIRSVSGKVLIKGKDLTGKRYHTFMRHGVAYMPASRMEEGLIPDLTLTEHVILCGEQKGLSFDLKKASAFTTEKIDDFNIRGKPDTKVEDLSGGNQQRALLALLKPNLRLLLMEHPTRGLDVESAIYIWSKLKDRCRWDSAIIFISSDLDEILQYSDRILVFFSGKVSAPIDTNKIDVEQLGQMIGGKGWTPEDIPDGSRERM